MSDTAADLIRSLLVSHIREHGEVPVDVLVELLWADETVGNVYGFPEETVRAILEELVTKNLIEWDRGDDVVRTRAGSDIDTFGYLSEPRTVGKWEFTIIGTYHQSDGSGVDIHKIWDVLEKKRMEFGDFRPHFSEDTERIDVSWTISGIECCCYWSERAFHIHSVMFEEPRREVLEYIKAKPEPIPTFVTKAIPFSAAYLVYEFMKSVTCTAYPLLTFRLAKVRESFTKERDQP